MSLEAYIPWLCFSFSFTFTFGSATQFSFNFNVVFLSPHTALVCCFLSWPTRIIFAFSTFSCSFTALLLYICSTTSIYIHIIYGLLEVGLNIS